MDSAVAICNLHHHHENSWRRSYPHFAKIVRSMSLQIGVEIGVAFGGHAEHLLENTSVHRLVGIDPYLHIPDYDDAMNLPQEVFDDLYFYVLGRLSRFGNRYFLVRGTSKEVAPHVGPIDFVFIDGDHSYQGCRNDMVNYFPLLRPGGILAGHDYGYHEFPGIQKSVDEFCVANGLTLHVEPETVWWAQKSDAAKAIGS